MISFPVSSHVLSGGGLPTIGVCFLLGGVLPTIGVCFLLGCAAYEGACCLIRRVCAHY